MDSRTANPFLLVRISGAVCGLPLNDVVETMRRLATEPLAAAPDYVRGITVVRGIPAPVVDLGRLIEADAASEPGRYVTVRVGSRAVALAVESVIGIADLDTEAADVPPLLHSARREAVESLGTLDSELLVVLRPARLVPESLWTALDKGAVKP